MRTTYTAEFACTPQHLWRFLEEPALQKQWMKGIEENVSTSDGPRGVGATFRMRIREGRRVADYDGRITAYDPPRQLSVDLSGGGFPCGMVMHVHYQLTDLEKQTRLDYIAEMEAKQRLPLWMRLMMPLFRVFGKMQLRSFMKTLKRIAEAPAPVGGERGA